MRKRTAYALRGCAAAATLAALTVPSIAAAQAGIVVLRDVGPRNALHPTNGAALTVGTAPDPAVFGAVTGFAHAISDEDAAGVTAGGAGGSAVPSVISPILSQAFGPGASGTWRETGGRSGVGGAVNDAVGAGVGAMQGALASMRGVCC